jgi:hypothetical protein
MGSEEATAPITARPPELKPARQWRVDLKWVFGVPFTLVLAMALAMLAMFQATGREQAQQTIVKANQSIFDQQQFLQDTRLYAPQLMSFLESPDFARIVYDNPEALEAQVNAIPDDAGMPPVPTGDNPLAGANVDQNGPANGIKTMFSVYGIPLKVMSGSVHQALGGMLIVWGILLVLLGAAFIGFSRRLGRMVSPGVSLAIASWLPFLILGVVRAATGRWAEAGSTLTEESDRAVRAVMSPLLYGMIDPALSVYRMGAFLSVLLLVGAGIGALILRSRTGTSARESA